MASNLWESITGAALAATGATTPDAAPTSTPPGPWIVAMLSLLVVGGGLLLFTVVLFAMRRLRAARDERPVARPPTPDPWKEAGERVDPIDDDAEFEEDDDEDDEDDDVWEDEPEGPDDDDDDDDGEIDTRRPNRKSPPAVSN